MGMMVLLMEPDLVPGALRETRPHDQRQDLQHCKDQQLSTPGPEVKQTSIQPYSIISIVHMVIVATSSSITGSIDHHMKSLHGLISVGAR